MKIKDILILISILTIISSCSEFFEKDISSAEVYLIAPADSLETFNFEHNFKWDPVEGAEWYNLTIVSPGYERIEYFILDTNISKTSFEFQLEPGIYQWGVTALNYSSYTDQFYFTLIIDTNKTFANNIVSLISPKEIYFNETIIKLNWALMNDADKYRIEIRQEDWLTGTLIYAWDVLVDTISVTFDEGNYFWGVQAMDNETNARTNFSYKQIFIDISPPERPILFYPEDNLVLFENSIALQWIRGKNIGSQIIDSIYLAKDINFSEIEFKASTMDTTYVIQPEAGEYYWRVKSFDKAGNISDYSIHRKFTYNNQ